MGHAIEVARSAEAVEMAKLRPAGEADVLRSVQPLIDQFGVPERGSVKSAVDGYVLALKGRPLGAIKEAIVGFISGTVVGFNRTYMPTSAQIGGEVDRILERLSRSIDKARRHREQVEQQAEWEAEDDRRAAENTPEARARRRQLCDEAVARLRAASNVHRQEMSGLPEGWEPPPMLDRAGWAERRRQQHEEAEKRRVAIELREQMERRA